MQYMQDSKADRRTLLAAILPHVPFDGFSEKSFAQACRDLGLPAQTARRLCPHGAADLALDFFAEGDARLLAQLSQEKLDSLRMRERILKGVRLRFEIDEESREILARAVSVLSRPPHLASGALSLHRTVDIIWRAAGDQASDFNHYTKRAILAGVFSATLLRWLADAPGQHEGTWLFLERRIENVMKIEKAKLRLREQATRLPQVLGVISRLRFGGRPPAGKGD